MSLPKLIVIVGPTASGKTALAIKLAKKLVLNGVKGSGEIVSADSRQVYRGMDIGTAKPPLFFSPLVRGRLRGGAIPHHLIDIRNPDQSYTLAQYKKDAVKTINKIIKSGKIPFLVGGTGLYVSAIINNLEIPEVRPNKKLRTRLDQDRQKYGLKFLFERLVKLDPEAAYIIDPKNPRRIIRALEIALSTKKPFSQSRKRGPKLFDTLILGIMTTQKNLKRRIERRTGLMIKQGLVSEVKRLTTKYKIQNPAFDAIGYREIIDYLNAKISLKEAERQINRNTWLFSKRQMTWFRKMPVVWVKNQKEAETRIKKFITSP